MTFGDMKLTTKMLGICILVSLGMALLRFALDISFQTFEPVISWGIAGMMFMAWGAAEEECYILGRIVHELAAQVGGTAIADLEKFNGRPD